MQQRQFEFASGSGPVTISLLCREPPEAQQGRTLTWQLDDTESMSRSAQVGEPSAAAAASQADTGATAGAAPSDAPDLIGLDIWPASLALCRYLAANPQLVAGHQVIELGAGMGLAGLLCGLLGAAHVLLTDYEPRVLAHLSQNAALNGLQERCSFQQLDFRQPGSSLSAGQRGSWRLALAADVLYASLIAQPLIDTLKLLLHPEGVALIGHQVRRAIILDPTTRLPRLEDQDEPLEKFKAGCLAAGLQLRVVSSRATCSNVDSDPMVLLAVGWDAACLAQLPAVPADL